jgi:hypothetical protein
MSREEKVLNEQGEWVVYERGSHVPVGQVIPEAGERYMHWHDDIAEALVKSIRATYALKRKIPKGKSIPYDGPETTSSKLTSLPIGEQLKAHNLRFQEEEQGRDPLAVLVGIALALGMEQGWRYMMDEREPLTGYLEDIQEAFEEDLPPEIATMYRRRARHAAKRLEDHLNDPGRVLPGIWGKKEDQTDDRKDIRATLSELQGEDSDAA